MELIQAYLSRCPEPKSKPIQHHAPWARDVTSLSRRANALEDLFLEHGVALAQYRALEFATRIEREHLNDIHNVEREWEQALQELLEEEHRKRQRQKRRWHTVPLIWTCLCLLLIGLDLIIAILHRTH